MITILIKSLNVCAFYSIKPLINMLLYVCILFFDVASKYIFVKKKMYLFLIVIYVVLTLISKWTQCFEEAFYLETKHSTHITKLFFTIGD